MVCQKCKDQQHQECRRGTWCDCLHRVPSPEARALEELTALAQDMETDERPHL